MRDSLSLLWSWNRTIDRLPYLLTGAALFVVKYALDWFIAKQGFHVSWGPMYYLVWPNDEAFRIFQLTDDRRLFALTSRWLSRAERVRGFRAAVRHDPAHCAGLVAWEIAGVPRVRVREALTRRRLLVGGTEAYGGFFGIPLDEPRSLFIANTGVFTSVADVDQLAEAIEEAGTSGA